MVARDTPPELLGLVLLAPAPMTPLPTPEPQRTNMLASYQSREGVEAALTILAHGTLPAAFREQVIEDTLCGAPEAKSMWTAIGMIEDVSPSVGSISIPTLVVVGENDIVEPERRLRKEIPQVIPDAEFCVLAKVGHLAPLEDPHAVSAAIRQFVSLLPERAEAAFAEMVQTAATQ